MTGDLLKLLPRAMGQYIYQNRYDFFRGVTFTIRDVIGSPAKQLDMEECRNRAYERLMRDIPFVIEALKGGELKLDTNANNIAGRLGMIVYDITLTSMPSFPDVKFLEGFGTALAGAINDNQIDIWVYYDGYGDFHSLGELMERLRPQDMPAFTRARRDAFATNLKEDIFAPFRAPLRFDRHMIMTDVELNAVYSTAINNILDAFVYIWKCSGMDMAHPSYAAPPGTIVSRFSRRRTLSGGVLSKLPPPVAPAVQTGEVVAPPAEAVGAPAEGEIPPPPPPLPE